MPDFSGAPPDEPATRREIPDALRDDRVAQDGHPPEVGTYDTNVRRGIASVGSAFFGAQTMQNQNPANGLTMKQNLSEIEDSAIAETLVNLQAQQVAYEAALAATARAITPSLTDFLR
jgi:flagellar hook-associated protein 3 FlgL